jgi:hypothetical protein
MTIQFVNSLVYNVLTRIPDRINSGKKAFISDENLGVGGSSDWIMIPFAGERACWLPQLNKTNNQTIIIS